MADEVFDDDKFFEEILNDEDNEPEDDSEKEKSIEDDSEDHESEKDPKEETPTLEERLNALEKENKGLKKAVVEYRQERSQYKGRLDELTDIIKNGLNDRGSQTTEKNSDDKSGDSTSKESKKSAMDRLPVEFGEDGKAYVPADVVKELLAEDLQKVGSKAEELEKTLSEKDQVTQLQQEFENHVNTILDEKEGRAVAYEKMTKALKMLDKTVAEIQTEQGIEGVLPPGTAIDLLYQTEGALDDFEKMQLGVSVEELIRAFDSDYVFKKTLDGITNASVQESSQKSNQDDALIENLTEKPSSPSGSKSAKRNEGVLDKVSGFSTEDLLNLDDKSWRRIEKYLSEKEID